MRRTVEEHIIVEINEDPNLSNDRLRSYTSYVRIDIIF